MGGVKNKNNYDRIQIMLHWLTALAVFVLFGLGLWMTSLDYYSSWYRLAPAIHKSIGFVLVLAVVFRWFWRQRTGVPTPLPTHKKWETAFAHLVHLFFYVAILSMFFSGYFITTAKGQSLDVLGFISIPATITGVDSLKNYAEEVHEISAYIIIAVALLHALAAIKHHVYDKDRTLIRMMKAERTS